MKMIREKNIWLVHANDAVIAAHIKRPIPSKFSDILTEDEANTLYERGCVRDENNIVYRFTEIEIQD